MAFTPVSPWHSPELERNIRNLPHLQVPEATYFITFRCRRHIVLPPAARSIILATIRYWDSRRMDLDAVVVMPDHLHLLCRLLEGVQLGRLVSTIKSFSARRINRLLGRNGSLWQDERFDHIVRDEVSWENKMEYIRQNPVRKGLVQIPEEYPWLYVRGK